MDGSFQYLPARGGSPLRANCQLLQGDGSNFTATRDKGTGKAVPFTLGAAA